MPSNPVSSTPFVSNPLANRTIAAVRKNGAVTTVTRRDLEHTKRIDRAWGDYLGVLLARMGAVITCNGPPLPASLAPTLRYGKAWSTWPRSASF